MILQKEIAMVFVYLGVAWFGLAIIGSFFFGAFVRAGKGGDDDELG